MESGSLVDTLEDQEFGKQAGKFLGYLCHCCLLVEDKSWRMKVVQQFVVF